MIYDRPNWQVCRHSPLELWRKWRQEPLLKHVPPMDLVRWLRGLSTAKGSDPVHPLYWWAGVHRREFVNSPRGQVRLRNLFCLSAATEIALLWFDMTCRYCGEVTDFWWGNRPATWPASKQYAWLPASPQELNRELWDASLAVRLGGMCRNCVSVFNTKFAPLGGRDLWVPKTHHMLWQTDERTRDLVLDAFAAWLIGQEFKRYKRRLAA